MFLLLLPISFALESNDEFIGEYELEYDANGNLIKYNQYYYEYNSLNQLTKIKLGDNLGEVLVEYFYDQDGERIKKVVYLNEDVITTYYIDTNFVRVVNSEGTFDEIYYYANGQLVGKEESDGEIKYYHPDHLGSTNLVTDANSNIVEETKYKPFGQILSGGESRFGFTGQEKDKETSLMYYGARYYSPFLRKFTQPDTIIQDVYDPQSLNRYAYARNNPVKYVDESGHFWQVILGGALIGGAIGAGISMISQILNGASMFDGSMNWGAVWRSSITGATFGGVAAATFGIGPAVAGSGYAGFALGGAIAGFSGGRSSRLVSNLQSEDSWNKDLLNVKEIALETGLGAVFGLGGRAITNGLSSLKGGVRYVDPKSLKPVESIRSYGDLRTITNSMLKTGYDKSQPIEVVTLRDGRMAISQGHHRTRAAIEAGIKKVPVVEANPSEYPWRQYPPYGRATIEEVEYWAKRYATEHGGGW